MDYSFLRLYIWEMRSQEYLLTTIQLGKVITMVQFGTEDELSELDKRLFRYYF